MPRFFVPKEQVPVITGLPRTILVRGSDAHQIKAVLRMKPRDKLQILDGTGTLYNCEIADVAKEKIICRIVTTEQAATEATVKVTIAQGLPKAKKMDLIVEKCTELGVARIIPVSTERTIAKADKFSRWQKIAKEAAEQSGRSTIPEISPLMSFNEVVKLKKNYDLALIPWELEKETTLKTALAPVLLNYGTTILLLIGPEGGFSQKEVDAAVKAGFTPVTLGPRILRTETAGLAIMAMLNYQFEL